MRDRPPRPPSLQLRDDFIQAADRLSAAQRVLREAEREMEEAQFKFDQTHDRLLTEERIWAEHVAHGEFLTGGPVFHVFNWPRPEPTPA